MITLSSVLEKEFAVTQTKTPKLCNYINTLNGSVLLSEPTMSNNLSCMHCNGTNHICVFNNPSLSSERVWLCMNSDCVMSNVKNKSQATNTHVEPKRALEWSLFCEINGIGDIHHEVKFENIQQSPAKADYLRKFANKPSGIVFMEGDPGTGKTFASMAVCEFYTRKSPSCIFTTQKQMFNNWLEIFKTEKFSNYIHRVTNTSLLVIDDFGTSEVSPAFMSFFMDLIDNRMQWKERGTIITTNLDIKKFSSFCGEALTDRINTGQHFLFKGESRRMKVVL